MDVSVASFHEANKQQPPDFFWVWVFEQLANPDNDGKPLPSRNEQRKKLFVSWLEAHPDVVKERQGSKLLHGAGKGARQELDPANPRVPDSAFSLVFQEKDLTYILRLHDNVEHELTISAEDGEDRCATLWRLGCTGVLHKLRTERLKLHGLVAKSLSEADQEGLVVTAEELGRGGAAIVYGGTYRGHEVAVKRITLEGGVEVRLPKVVGAVDEINFGLAVAKAIKSKGPELAKHLCYCRRHRVVRRDDGTIMLDLLFPRYPGTLRTLMNKEGFKADKTFIQRVARHVLIGLHVASSGQINHAYLNRDIKPGNLLLEGWDPASDAVAEITVLVGDWGISRRGQPGNELWSGMTKDVGTESFRPGESKENTYGPKFDVYSLGMVILALVLGRSGDQPPGSYDDLKGDAVQQDEGLRDFLHQALERDQNKRPLAGVLLDHPFLKKNY